MNYGKVIYTTKKVNSPFESRRDNVDVFSLDKFSISPLHVPQLQLYLFYLTGQYILRPPTARGFLQELRSFSPSSLINCPVPKCRWATRGAGPSFVGPNERVENCKVKLAVKSTRRRPDRALYEFHVRRLLFIRLCLRRLCSPPERYVHFRNKCEIPAARALLFEKKERESIVGLLVYQ